MRVAGIVLSIVALLGSLLGALFIVQYLTSTDSDRSLGYVVGLIVAVPALGAGGLASLLFSSARRRDGRPRGWSWVPMCPPALVVLGLHLMLRFPGPSRDSDMIYCSEDTPCKGDPGPGAFKVGARKCVAPPTSECKRMCAADTDCQTGFGCLEMSDLRNSPVRVCMPRASSTPSSTSSTAAPPTR